MPQHRHTGSLHILAGQSHITQLSTTERMFLEARGAEVGAKTVMASQRAGGNIGFILKDGKGKIVGRTTRNDLATPFSVSEAKS